MEEEDRRFRYLYKQVLGAYRHIPIEKFREFWYNDYTKRKFIDFFNNEDVGSILIREMSKNSLELVENQQILNSSKSCFIFYIIKLGNVIITEENITELVIFGDLPPDPIGHLSSITQQIYVPFINNSIKRNEWTEAIKKDISSTFEKFLSDIQITEGHVKGATFLPLPSLGNSILNDLSDNISESVNVNLSKNKLIPRIHELENIIIVWAKQIKNVLKRNSEDLLIEKQSPCPLVEVEFWRSRSKNLNGIFKQLQNPTVRRIIKILDFFKSSYNEPFVKLCKEVSNSRTEANDVQKYLCPLTSYLEKLESESSFETILTHVYPVFRLLLIISSRSNHYNTTGKITVMLKMIGNVIIWHTTQYLTNENIFNLLYENPFESMRHLSIAVKIMTKYKEIFHLYQSKAASIAAEYMRDPNTSSRPSTSQTVWSSISASAIFFKIDLFLDRCYDLLDLGQTVSQYTKLSKIEIGGTKGKVLSSTVFQIYGDFEKSLDYIKNTSSIMLEFENKQFDMAFAEFSTEMKELDRRLSSLILNSFDDAVGITGKFRLLETFDGLTQRPIIHDSLEKKYSILVSLIRSDICDVEKVFVGYRDNPPLPHNLPPVAGALTWSRGLLQRIQGPHEKLLSMDGSLLKRDDVKEVLKVFSTFASHLNDFNHEKIELWCRSIEETSQSKLRNPLLKRDFSRQAAAPYPSPPLSPVFQYDANSSFNFNYSNSTVPTLRVNFDPLLVRLLREVKYFILLGMDVPSSAKDIYQLVEVFRRQTGNLELIVNMYNDIQASLLPVERPLIKSLLDHIDKTLSQGIAESQSKIKDNGAPGTNSGSKSLNWKSSTIDIFISEAMTEVRESTDILQTLKGCLKRIEQIVEGWLSQPTFERNSKTLSVDDFYVFQQKVRRAKSSQIKESGQEVHRILKEINRKLKLSQVANDWKAYVDFINNYIVDGLINSTTLSLSIFGNQLNPKKIETEIKIPMIEIQLDLINGNVSFVPDIGGNLSKSPSMPKQLSASLLSASSPSNNRDESDQLMSPHFDNQITSSVSGLRNMKLFIGTNTNSKHGNIKEMFQTIMNGMVGTASTFKRIDTGEGNYLQEIYEGPDIKTQRSKVFHYLAFTEKKCESIKLIYANYEYLWKDDINKKFMDFLSIAVEEEKVHFIVESNSTTANQSNISLKVPASPRGFGSSSPGSSPHEINFHHEHGQPANISENGYWIKTNINLDLFGEKISRFTELLSEISDIKATYEIDFLKINAQPIKQAIFTYATKWLYTYTKYLQDYLIDRLTNIHDLIRDINKGLDQIIEPSDREAMMSVVTYIRDVRKHTPEMASLFDPLRSIVFLLKVKNISLELPQIGGYAALDFLEQAAMQWDNIVNKAYRVKESIQPLQTVMVEGIKKDVKAFDANCIKLVKDFIQNGSFQWVELSAAASVYQSINKYYSQLSSLKETGKSINELQDLFELPLSTHQQLTELFGFLKTLKAVWDLVWVVESSFNSWKGTLWVDIRIDDLIEDVKRFDKQIRKLYKSAKDWPVFRRLEINVSNMGRVLPLLQELHSSAIQERHWKQLIQQTAQPQNSSSKMMGLRSTSFCLHDILSLNFQNYSEILMDIVDTAQKELKIESRLNQIDNNWNKYALDFLRHRDTDVFVISPPDEILDALEENHLQLQSMAGMGRNVDFFRDRVVKWQSTLGEVENTLKLLLTVSKQWGSLESIFLGSADIRAQLPEDTKRFENMDNEFKEIMRDIQSNPKVIAACTVEGREQSLRQMFKELEKCEKELNEYLEIKKSAFPRFYFVANAALLDILSNGNNPPKIMPHIGSIFDGIGDLELCLSPAQLMLHNETNVISDNVIVKLGVDEVVNLNLSQCVMIPNAAKAMVSKDNEVVEFVRLFEMKNAVEIWLHDLVKCMHLTLKTSLKASMIDLSSWIEEGAREEWLFSVSAQIALLTSQIVWSDEVENALEEIEGGQEDSMKKYNDVCTLRLQGLIRLIQGSLSKSDRNKIITLITIDVHNRDVVTSLVQKKVESNIDFNWQSQLRYYWAPEDMTSNIKICDFATVYSFEYIGNCGRLVITPLTDRCYVTLTTALKLTMGGSPSGPAGTGKTETVKDLARGLGLPCYVFNCSDQMNYQSMADIFKGLAQVGAWGCFDEFNRIDIEVLSVVATQVRCILDAVNFLSVPTNRGPQYQYLPAGNPPVKVGVFNFFEEQISLIPTVGLFITMNPGYAGRTELPENLKALFRSCAMVQPDLLPICENMLMAEGFIKARPLAVKFVTLYKLSSELLSKQNHYDFGLRAIKSVLRVAGILKRADPEFAEEAILMRALRDFNTPKVPNNDLPIFLRLVSDLFPGLDLAPKINIKLRDLCVEVCKANGLQPDEVFLSKVLQYQEILDIRHSVMLLGPAGCGKTTIWKTLVKAHNYGKPKPSTVYDIINPKVLTTDELFGYMTLSKDWKDGALSIIMRNMSTNTSPYSSSQTAKWVVLDGDIDAIWIESMNTVMDDNKVLTLVSNERIPLNESMRMVFEVDSLRNATPATVSRAGILYVNDSDIGYEPYVESWLASRTGSDTDRSSLADIFDRYLHKVIDFFVASKLETIVKLPLINLVQSLCCLLEGTLNLYQGDKAFNNQVMERIFIHCLMWSFGGALSSENKASLTQSTIDTRKSFSVFFKSLVKIVKFPDNGLVFDFFIEPLTGEVVSWQSKLPTLASNSSTSHRHLFIPTADTLRLKYLLEASVSSGRPAMIVGGSGTGKSVIMMDYLSSLTSTTKQSGNQTLKDASTFKFVSIYLNFYTSSSTIQHQLEQHIDKRSGKTYGPPTGKLIYFIDDINLPQPEEYGTQTPIAFLRQHIDHNCWLDRQDLSLKKFVINCQYVSCMNNKIGSFEIDPRLQRHFTTLSCQMPSDIDLGTIVHAVLNQHFVSPEYDSKAQAFSGNLADATVSVLKEVLLKFLPSAVKFHYLFTIRDAIAVVEGLLSFSYTKMTSTKNGITSQMTRLWYHENMRVYSDRFLTESEVVKFHDSVVSIGKKYLDEDEELYSEPCIFSQQSIDVSAPAFVKSVDNKPTFRATLSLSNQQESRYGIIDNIQALRQELESKLSSYNETHSIMDLVLFEQAIHHTCRILRILKSSPSGSGNGLLIGVGGSGKQSLSRLAAYIYGYDVYQLSLTQEFTHQDFKEYLRELYRKAGVKPATPLVFLLTDNDIIDDRFLVYISEYLSSGFIPDLFSKEEYDAIFNAIRNIAKSEGVPDTRNDMLAFFLGRVRSNLHIILCHSPVGETFRQRVRKFPGLLSQTCIDWYHEWKRDALVSVALKFLDDINISDLAKISPQPPTIDIKASLAYHIAEVHSTVATMSQQYLLSEKRHNYATPKSFLGLIACYKQLLHKKREEMSQSIRRLETGLETLVRTNADVNKLQEYLKEKKKEVEAKKSAADALLEEMGKQRAEAEAQQAIADAERMKADDLASQAKAIESQAAGDLAIAKPAMDAASLAVDCLDKASMTELKSFTKPPNGVEKVTSAILIMIKNEKRDFSWENAKKMMAKLDNFKEKLETFNAEDIPEDIISRVKPFLDDPEFTYDRMKSKSLASANLTNWVVNTLAYHEIYQRVKPLMNSLEVATSAKQAAEEELDIVKQKLSVIEEKLQGLQSQFMAASSEKAKVEFEYKDLLDRLALAERLTTGLSSENERWAQTVMKLRELEYALIGDAMLAASFVSYIGAFSTTFRRKLWSEIWLPDLLARGIPLSGANIDPLNVITSEAQICDWKNNSLPDDRMSIENGAIILNSSRWPLLIDPQGQGLAWLKKQEAVRTKSAGTQLVVIQSNDKFLMKKLVASIRAGDTVILENIDQNIDASWSPIISKSVYKKNKNGGYFIRLMDDDIEYDNRFQLYLQTRIANPHYRPEISAQCLIINFNVTRRGLEDQLLSVIVTEEEPELENSRQSLLQSLQSYRSQLLDLEDNLLERLSNAPADILSDVALIESLEALKLKSSDISEAMKKAVASEYGLNQAREIYRNVAVEASILYFLMLQFSSIDSMYQYSLESFMYFFLKAIKSCVTTDNGQSYGQNMATQENSSASHGNLAAYASESKQDRVKNLQYSLRWTISKWVLRGLFDKHRLLFLVQLTVNLLQCNILPQEALGYKSEILRFVLFGSSGLDTGIANNNRGLSSPTRNPSDEKSPVPWISDTMWSAIRDLANIKGFEKLPLDIEENSARFLEWYQNYTPETEKLPGDWRELEKHPFLKLAVIRVLRPDRMISSLTNFIRDALPNGRAFVESDSECSSYQVLEQIYADSSPRSPIYFILSPGADVVSDVDKLAMKNGKVKGLDYFNISLGQGQDVVANERLEAGYRQGHWIFLNNIHLMPRWLPFLEKKLDEYNSLLSSTEPLPRKQQTSSPTAASPSNAKNQLLSPTDSDWKSQQSEEKDKESDQDQDSSTPTQPGTHPNFRIFLSSDPSDGIPNSILNRSIKISSDPPSGLKANLRQAVACISKETYDELEPRTRGILFGLCQFHAVMIERKKFGTKGFNMQYPFNIGDLTCSFAVLKNYMESAPAKIPWTDLRYIFGEIMYGGHIVNYYDRILAKSYLEFYMKEDLMDEMSLFPFLDSSPQSSGTQSGGNSGTNAIPVTSGGPNSDATFEAMLFKAPSISYSYEQMLQHIDECLRHETPAAYGLHSNSEIGYLTNLSNTLLKTVLELTSESDSSTALSVPKPTEIAPPPMLLKGHSQSSLTESLHSSSGKSPERTHIDEVIQEINELVRDVKYDIAALSTSIEDVGPFQNVVLQECDRMNCLINTIQSSLSELELGFKGELTMTEAMEDLENSLNFDRVPKKWEMKAYPSLRSLGSWLSDLNNRISQLNDWSSNLSDMPISTWIGGLFNPQSFITAIMQINAQTTGYELDRLTLITDVTKKQFTEEITASAKDGAYIFGINLEGASWNLAQSQLEVSRPKEVYSPLPVIHIKPLVVEKVDSAMYECPVYKTQQRGPTYVFSLQLKTKLDPSKWVLSGTVGLMDTS